ncbi:MAG: helix-turn-helix transcriptional regulator [Eudoraea sp.]|nr:helix-turn-helix transcriptional regulator [Eudoraea sp.]
MKQKPRLEVVKPNFGNSFTYLKFNSENVNKDIMWHYHPELELVYVRGGSGRRQIGSHVSYYSDSTLILIGSNLPHCGFTDRLTENKDETVLQMREDFLGNEFFNSPELAKIRTMFEKAKGGIAFRGQTKKLVGSKLEELGDQPEFSRLISVLEILQLLGSSDEFRVLNAEGYSLEASVKDNDRISIVFNFVKQNYKEEIALETIADIVSMTIPSFCRYFKKMTNKTFTQFVNEYRLVHASKLLAEKPMTITEVCYESGFNNFSHFSKTFKAFTGHSPSDYRKQLKTVLN